MKPTDKSIHGTSYKLTFKVHPADLLDVLGEPHATSGDKTNYEWFLETESGEVFTVYDWKTPAEHWEHRIPIELNIGAFTTEAAQDGLNEIKQAIKEMFK